MDSNANGNSGKTLHLRSTCFALLIAFRCGLLNDEMQIVFFTLQYPCSKVFRHLSVLLVINTLRRETLFAPAIPLARHGRSTDKVFFPELPERDPTTISPRRWYRSSLLMTYWLEICYSALTKVARRTTAV